MIDLGLIDAAAADRARQIARQECSDLFDELLKHSGCAEFEVLQAVGKTLGLHCMSADTFVIDKEVVELIPEDLARRHGMIPLFNVEGMLCVATSNPFDVEALDALRRLGHRQVSFTLMERHLIQEAIDEHCGVENRLTIFVANLRRKLGSEDDLEESASIPALVNCMISEAIRQEASDIHIEPTETQVGVRFRVDGALRSTVTLPREIHSAVVSRLKIMAQLDIAEKRLPLDGRLKVEHSGRDIDIRLSTLPTVDGEKIVMRLLDRGGISLDLRDLGFGDRNLAAVERAIAQPHGINLITGPTGSGKTTTLYACLNAIRSETKNIITIENPVEYRLEMVNQVQVNTQVGLEFANALRSILRQDPDVIMVGEIRDGETARIAIQSALTGHMVLSTLHTNDAVGAVTRLVDMGVEPYLVSSSVQASVAQRLLRRVCADCREPIATPVALLEELHQSTEGEFVRGAGCPRCMHSGHRGRLGIYEVLEMNEAMRRLVVERAGEGAIGDVARESGFRGLAEDGFDKARRGLTTIEEVIRVAGGRER